MFLKRGIFYQEFLSNNLLYSEWAITCTWKIKIIFIPFRNYPGYHNYSQHHFHFKYQLVFKALCSVLPFWTRVRRKHALCEIFHKFSSNFETIDPSCFLWNILYERFKCGQVEDALKYIQIINYHVLQFHPCTAFMMNETSL